MRRPECPPIRVEYPITLDESEAAVEFEWLSSKQLKVNMAKQCLDDVKAVIIGEIGLISITIKRRLSQKVPIDG
jgi:hypothetical protein